MSQVLDVASRVDGMSAGPSVQDLLGGEVSDLSVAVDAVGLVQPFARL